MNEDPTVAAEARADGSEASGLAFGPGWDRQDRWLRFVDPILERSYLEAVTPAARRRLRIAVPIGCVAWATAPLQAVVLYGHSPTVEIVAAVVTIAAAIAGAVWAGRVGLRGIWGLSCGLSAVFAIGFVATGVDVGNFLWLQAVLFAALGVVLIVVIRVAWWVAAAMSVLGVALFGVVGLALGDSFKATNEAIWLAVALGMATLGSRFLENAERRTFAQGLLIADLHRRVDRLFHQYLSPDVAQALVEDPRRAELGGEVVEVSVLFADLRGYTPFSERRSPADVVSMLNAAFGAAVPAVFAEGGTIVQFVGDALMAIFNAPLRQTDHALRACRAAIALQRAVTAAGPSAGRPRFRVGVNTGPALVGNVGSAELRNFSALGDTTNVAARLQTYAEEGSVVIGERTYELIRDWADVRALGPVDLKGKSRPTMVFELVGLRETEYRSGSEQVAVAG